MVMTEVSLIVDSSCVVSPGFVVLMTWGLNKSSSSSSSSTTAAGRSSSSSVDGEFHDAAEYTTDLQEGHSTGKAATTKTATARRTQQSLRLAPQVDEANDDDESMLLDDSGTPSTSLEPFELGACDDEQKGLTTYDGAHHHHHHDGSTIVLPDTYSSVIMDCDNINDGGSTCGGSPEYDTTEQDRERQRRRQQGGGSSSNDFGRGNGDEEDDDGGVLWNLKQNLVNKGLSWSDRLLDTTEAALDVTEKAVGFILSDDNTTTTAASKSEGSDGQTSNQQPNNPPEGEGETEKKEEPLPVEEEKEGHHSLSEPALSVGEYSSFSDDDESIRSR
ncbi:hypothetical protein FOZ60_001011 [Perkinsus olseni]|uniref:Uncharacterized protein n=1 Tax=Perkinsus olseni TaxID=32597 RepID=A0A7J6P1D4_PEROL|nr:hypothetical protein FOZ60_001011 [Perkinsus olseni]